MLLPNHLQILLAECSVAVVPDNACTHGKRQIQRKPPKRNLSAPIQKTSTSRSSQLCGQSSSRRLRREVPKRHLCRWESMPTTSCSSDAAPVLIPRRLPTKSYGTDVSPVLAVSHMENRVITLANTIRTVARDVPPVYRRTLPESSERRSVSSIRSILERGNVVFSDAGAPADVCFKAQKNNPVTIDTSIHTV